MTFALHVYDADLDETFDPTTDAIGVIDMTDSAIEARFTDVHHGIGSMMIKIPRDHPAADLLQADRFVILETNAGMLDPGYFLEEGEVDLSSEDESGGEMLVWEGQGSGSVLERARMDDTSSITGGQNPIQGFWDLSNQGDFAGDSNGHPIPMMKRSLVEVNANSVDPIPMVDHSGWDYDADSDASTPPFWGEIVFGVDIGDDLVAIWQRMDELGGVTFRMHRDFEFSSHLAFGVDRQGAFGGTDKVRFEKGVNVTVALKRKIRANVRKTHMIVGGADNSYLTVVNPTYTPGDIIRVGFLSVPETSDETALEAAALANFLARERASDVYVLPMPDHGDDPANGLYEPGVHFNVGDTPTFHTGSGTHDVNEAGTPIAAITWRTAEGTDYVYDVELGYDYHWTEGPGDAFGAGSQARSLRLCDPPMVIQTSTAWKADETATPAAGWHEAGFDDSGYSNAANTSDPGFFDDPSPRWIWSTAGTESDASLRTEFTLAALPSMALLNFGVDGAGSIYINDELIATYGTGDASWLAPPTILVDPSHFAVGANCISIIATTEDDNEEQDGAYAVLTINPEASTSSKAARCHHTHLVESLLTAESDTSKALRPDGTGGVEWVADDGTGLPWFIPEDYGAVGDGTTDDTLQVEDTIQAFNAAGGGTLYLPGKYLISMNPTAITGNGRILSDGGSSWNAGEFQSGIICNSPTVTPLTIQSKRLRVENLAGKNTSGTTESAGAFIVATSADPLQRVDYVNVTVDGFYDGIDQQVGMAWVMDSCMFRSQVRYQARVRNIVDDDFGDWSIKNCGFWGSGGAPAMLRIESSGGGRITSNKFNQNGASRAVTAIDLALGSGISTSILIVADNSFENMSGDAITFSTASSSGSWRIHIIAGNHFGLHSNNTGRAIKYNPTTTGQFEQIVISHNVFGAYGTARAALELNSIDGVTLVGNRLEGSGFTTLWTGTATNVTEIAGGVSDHAALTGLADDDHTQYLNEARHTALGHAAGLVTVDPGTVSYDHSGSEVVVEVSAVWGYDGDGPYYDDAGVTAGEEAILALDPETGDMTLIPYNP